MSHFSVEVSGGDGLSVFLDVALQDPGLEVVGTAGDAESAIDLADREHPDVIVLDDELMGDVQHVARRVGEKSPDTRVVIVSSSDRPGGLLRDADGVLERTLSPARIVAEVSSMLSAAARSAGVTLPRDLRSAGTARQLVKDAASAWGAGGVEDTLALLASELVANAVRHGESDVEIMIRLNGDAVRVEVRDRSGGDALRREATEDAESGRGLALVEALSEAWGVDPTPEGKSVWFELAKP